MPAPAYDCLAELTKLHTAYMALVTGARVATVSYGERSVTYTQGQMRDLQMVYRTHYRACGADSGLPDISAQASVERGPPADYSPLR